MFEIEKDVPLGRSTGARERKYPLDIMEVGDSFALPVEARQKVVSAASYFGARNRRKFSIKRHGDGYRCWRVK